MEETTLCVPKSDYSSIHSCYLQVQASTAYLDRHYGVGEETRQLLSGYDCPYGALVLNATYHTEDEYYTSPGAICIFEVLIFSIIYICRG